MNAARGTVLVCALLFPILAGLSWIAELPLDYQAPAPEPPTGTRQETPEPTSKLREARGIALPHAPQKPLQPARARGEAGALGAPPSTSRYAALQQIMQDRRAGSGGLVAPWGMGGGVAQMRDSPLFQGEGGLPPPLDTSWQNPQLDPQRGMQQGSQQGVQQGSQVPPLGMLRLHSQVPSAGTGQDSSALVSSGSGQTGSALPSSIMAQSSASSASVGHDSALPPSSAGQSMSPSSIVGQGSVLPSSIMGQSSSSFPSVGQDSAPPPPSVVQSISSSSVGQVSALLSPIMGQSNSSSSSVSQGGYVLPSTSSQQGDSELPFLHQTLGGSAPPPSSMGQVGSALPSLKMKQNGSAPPSSSVGRDGSVLPSLNVSQGSSATPSPSVGQGGSALPSLNMTQGASSTPSSSVGQVGSVLPSLNLTQGESAPLLSSVGGSVLSSLNSTPGGLAPLSSSVGSSALLNSSWQQGRSPFPSSRMGQGSSVLPLPSVGGSALPLTRMGQGSSVLPLPSVGGSALPLTRMGQGSSVLPLPSVGGSALPLTRMGQGSSVLPLPSVGGSALPLTRMGQGSSVLPLPSVGGSALPLTRMGQGSSVLPLPSVGGSALPLTSMGQGSSVLQSSSVRMNSTLGWSPNQGRQNVFVLGTEGGGIHWDDAPASAVQVMRQALTSSGAAVDASTRPAPSPIPPSATGNAAQQVLKNSLLPFPSTHSPIALGGSLQQPPQVQVERQGLGNKSQIGTFSTPPLSSPNYASQQLLLQESRTSMDASEAGPTVQGAARGGAGFAAGGVGGGIGVGGRSPGGGVDGGSVQASSVTTAAAGAQALGWAGAGVGSAGGGGLDKNVFALGEAFEAQLSQEFMRPPSLEDGLLDRERGARWKAERSMWNRTYPMPAKANGGLFDPDRELLIKYMRQAGRMLEWGMGESTRIAAAVGVPHVRSLDSDFGYVSGVQQDVPPNWDLNFVYIGPIVAWGRPKGTSHRAHWPRYADFGVERQDPFDLYYVDGRFRVSCALLALIHGSANGTRTRDDFVVMIHDWEVDWRGYHAVLHFADIVDGSDSGNPDPEYKYRLVVLRRKAGVTDEQIRAFRRMYIYEYN